MGIELERVLVRLEESNGVENVALDEEAAHAALGALSLVDPKLVDRGAKCLSGSPAG